MKEVIIAARFLSSVFRPVYYPLLGFVLLLTLTYMSLLPWAVKFWLVGMVYLLTIALPQLGVYFYRKSNNWHLHELRQQHKRRIPYLIYLFSYLCLMFLLEHIHMPRFMISIVAVSLLIQCVCILLNMKWKVSVHSAGSGAIIGALLAYSGLFGFNPLWWLCGAIILSGLVMTSRMLLRQHSLWQVLGGTLVGVVCAYFGIIIM